MDGVLFGKFDSEWAFEGVEVGECELDDFGTGAAAQEEGGFGILVGLGCLFVEGALRTGITWFSGINCQSDDHINLIQ